MTTAQLALTLGTAVQALALLVLLLRLLPGRRRRPPVAPVDDQGAAGRVTVVVATLDEARRIGPCLAGLQRQGPTMLEALIVDSHSTDGTWELAQEAAARDPRIRPLHDPPLPPEWVGKVWALQHGLQEARGEWVLGIDADTEPRAGLVAGVLAAAEQYGFDAVSFAPQFEDMTVAEQWLQPAMLATLVYRFGAVGERQPAPDRVMANGQCFLARRSLLLANGGYESARKSWCDDVTLARHLARQGARVGFLDGSRVIGVRAYDSIGQMWREWGRSIDLKDANTPLGQAWDALFVVLAQGVPLPAVLLALLLHAPDWRAGGPALWWLAVNGILLAMRILLQFALAANYRVRHWTFWASVTADPVAAVRIVLSSLKRPRRWRTRAYVADTVVEASPAA